MYTLVDIVDKLIDVERQARDIYEQIAIMEDAIPSVRTIARVLKSEEERHVEYYTKLRKELNQKDLPMLDFIAYDKVSSLFNEFKSRFTLPHPETPQEILHYAYRFEQENKALVIDVQGRLLARESEAGDKIEEVLYQVIKEKERHIQNLKQFLREA